jgi:tetratricopeptide (TPR) repeat protein
MKARLFSLMLGLVAFGHAAHAQNTGYKMNVKMTDGSFFSVPADDVSEVYFTTTEEKQFTDTYYTVSGRAEKGPFKSGANVTMQPLDPLLNALGSPQSTLTFNDCGNYSFRNSLFKYPYVQVTAKGLFYNEYNDLKTRDAQLTLYSYADIQGNSTVNANIVTHLISERFVNLVLGGMDFDAALHKSQGELLAAFGLQRLNDKDFTKVSITDGDDYAAALLAIGIPMLLWRDGAELTTFINQLRYDFADDGKLTEPNKQQFNHDRNVTSQRELIEKLIAKYKEYGMDVSVKDLKYFYDWDDDGVAGNEIYDPSQPATYDVTSISAPMNGGTYTVNVSCNVPLYTSPLNYGDANSSPYYEPFIQSDMSLTTTYNDGVLSITVNPAQYRIISDRTVVLYDAVGNIAVSVTVSQEGNPSGTFLTELGKIYVRGICQNLSSTHARYRIADAKYTGLTENNDFHAPLDVYNSNLNYLFSYPYQLIRRNMEAFRNASSPSVYALLPMAVLTNSLAYYELVTMFGGVPYINQEQDMYNYNIPRTSQDEILNKLVEDLTSIMDKLQDNKGGYIASEDDIAMPSKDLARVVLADIYMYQGNYNAAKVLLAEIVNGGKYSLIAEQNGMGGNNAEIIWSMPTSYSGGDVTRAIAIDYNAPYTIIKTYADVLLSLAECESKLGNVTKANEYLNQVKSAKSIETTSSGIIPEISEVRSKIQIDFGGYFAFLKRTGLAMSTLGLAEYQLLFPIPQSELYTNSAMTQNPGYNGGTR